MSQRFDHYSEEPEEGKPGWHRVPGEPDCLRWWTGTDWSGDVYPAPKPDIPSTHRAGSDARIDVPMWTADAVVLYNWLSKVEWASIPFVHRAESQALTDLLTALEGCVVPPSDDEIAVARHDVAQDMPDDWPGFPKGTD